MIGLAVAFDAGVFAAVVTGRLAARFDARRAKSRATR